MPFHFSLQRVLDYREQLRDKAQVDFARAQAELLREQTRASEIEQQLAAQTAALLDTSPEKRDDRWILENYIRGLREDLAVAQMRVRSLSALVEECRKELALRAKEHKVLDKLKEKQATHYALELRYQEQRTYDETAALRFKAPTV